MNKSIMSFITFSLLSLSTIQAVRPPRTSNQNQHEDIAQLMVSLRYQMNPSSRIIRAGRSQSLPGPVALATQLNLPTNFTQVSGRYLCPYCSHSTGSQKNTIVQHMISKHANIRIQCLDCNAQVSYSQWTSEHRTMCSNQRDNHESTSSTSRYQSQTQSASSRTRPCITRIPRTHAVRPIPTTLRTSRTSQPNTISSNQLRGISSAAYRDSQVTVDAQQLHALRVGMACDLVNDAKNAHPNNVEAQKIFVQEYLQEKTQKCPDMVESIEYIRGLTRMYLTPALEPVPTQLPRLNTTSLGDTLTQEPVTPANVGNRIARLSSSDPEFWDALCKSAVNSNSRTR